MTYYWLLLIIILLISVGTKTSEKKKDSALIPCIALFFIFFAFRVGFTPDYYNYDALFDKYHLRSFLDDNAAQEIGFQWLCQIMPTYRSIVVLFSFLYCICLYITLKYGVEKKYWWFSWFLLFCYPSFVLGNMSGMRSGIVTCFFFLALYIKLKVPGAKGLAVALSLMIMAFMMHRSAAVITPLLLIPSTRFNKKILYIIYTIAALFIIISLFFPNILNQLALFLTVYFFKDYNYANDFGKDVDTGIGISSIIKTAVVVYLLYTTLACEQTEKDKKNTLFLKMTALYYVLILAPANIGLISRFYYYFAFPCMIGSVVAIKSLQKDKRRLYIACAILFAFWQIYYFYRRHSIYHYMEYHNILFQ